MVMEHCIKVNFIYSLSITKVDWGVGVGRKKRSRKLLTAFKLGFILVICCLKMESNISKILFCLLQTKY